MSKPNMNCGECDGRCLNCDYFDPYKGECSREETDEYAFVSPDNDDISDEEYESAAEEAYDNLVRSLVEAGGEIRELKEVLREAKDALLYMLILHKAQDPRCNQEKVVPALYMLQSGPDKWTPERADKVFKKVFDYLEKEENNGA
jgi:type I restriction-modification system DNA methylase subunit